MLAYIKFVTVCMVVFNLNIWLITHMTEFHVIPYYVYQQSVMEYFSANTLDIIAVIN
jgi:hypothetical protein